jgi:site-specific recombinase XerD
MAKDLLPRNIFGAPVDLDFRPEVPSTIGDAGRVAAEKFAEFFTAKTNNRNTRKAYYHAARMFFSWMRRHRVALQTIRPFHVAAYVNELESRFSKPTVKQHLAGIRMLFDSLVVDQVVPMNPAASVRGPKHSQKEGKTPVLDEDQARHLLERIDTSNVVGLRDRALIGVLLYAFARVGAVCAMNVQDFFAQGKRWWFLLHEKGGKNHKMPAHHRAEEFMDAYIEAENIAGDKKAPLFRTTPVLAEL